MLSVGILATKLQEISQIIRINTGRLIHRIAGFLLVDETTVQEISLNTICTRTIEYGEDREYDIYGSVSVTSKAWFTFGSLSRWSR